MKYRVSPLHILERSTPVTTRDFVSVALNLIAAYYLIQTLPGLVGGGGPQVEVG